MRNLMCVAPARRLARAGAFAIAVMVACDDAPGVDEGPRVLELDHDTIRLESGVALIDVAVRRAEDGDFYPAVVTAKQRDVIRFTADDNGGHAIVFEGTALAGPAQQWLESTAQLRSPPLIASGSSWVITLEGAPPGEYPFRCVTHGATGSLTVAPR